MIFVNTELHCQDNFKPVDKSTAASCCHQMGLELAPGDHKFTTEMLEKMAKVVKDNNLTTVWLSLVERQETKWTWINNGS